MYRNPLSPHIIFNTSYPLRITLNTSPTLNPRHPSPSARLAAAHRRHGLQDPASLDDDDEGVHDVLPVADARSPTQRAVAGVLVDSPRHLRGSAGRRSPDRLDQHVVAGLPETRPNRRHQPPRHHDVPQSAEVSPAGVVVDFRFTYDLEYLGISYIL